MRMIGLIVRISRTGRALSSDYSNRGTLRISEPEAAFVLLQADPAVSSYSSVLSSREDSEDLTGASTDIRVTLKIGGAFVTPYARSNSNSNSNTVCSQ
jgi:hypothetical protein